MTDETTEPQQVTSEAGGWLPEAPEDAYPADATPLDPPDAAGEWDANTIEEIRAAERAAQASVCHIPDGKRPKVLDKALERRVEVNLAQYDGGEISRVGSTDPEVRRLEAPFSRRRAAGSIDTNQEGQS